MKTLLALFVLVVGVCAVGCSGGNSTDGTPKVQGKVEIKDTPEGTSAPGDKRPTPGETAKTNESGSRG